MKEVKLDLQQKILFLKSMNYVFTFTTVKVFTFVNCSVEGETKNDREKKRGDTKNTNQFLSIIYELF